jgi:AbrB family looped-hinge helix DNA binding protein
MSRLLALTGKELHTALQQLGFESLRVKGSDHLLRHPDDRTMVVPIHAGETIGPGLLNSFLRQVKLSRDYLSSKGQLVIPARLRQLLGLQPADRLALSLEADGLRLVPERHENSRSARSLIGCTGYQGPSLSLEQMDPARFPEA